MWVEVVKLVLLFSFTRVSVTVGLVIIENCFKMLFWGATGKQCLQRHFLN